MAEPQGLLPEYQIFIKIAAALQINTASHIEGDLSGLSKPIVDIDLKVAF